MKRLLLAAIVLGFSHALIAQTETPKSDTGFQSAKALAVGILQAFSPCLKPGTVVLNVLISPTGEVVDIEVRRDVPCFTKLAIQWVKDWKFSPAALGGKAVASRIPVAVTFGPSLTNDSLSLPKLIPQSAAAIQAEFQPAEVKLATFPRFITTVDAANGGDVVLEAIVDAKGKLDQIKVLLDLPPFTANTIASMKEWRFMPATFNGRPVPSNILLGFVVELPHYYNH